MLHLFIARNLKDKSVSIYIDADIQKSKGHAQQDCVEY